MMKLISIALCTIGFLALTSCQSEAKFISGVYSFCNELAEDFPDSFTVLHRDDRCYIVFDFDDKLVSAYRRNIWRKEYTRDPKFQEGWLDDSVIVPLLKVAESLNIGQFRKDTCFNVWATPLFDTDLSYLFAYSEEQDSIGRQKLLMDFCKEVNLTKDICGKGDMHYMSWVVLKEQRGN